MSTKRYLIVNPGNDTRSAGDALVIKTKGVGGAADVLEWQTIQGGGGTPSNYLKTIAKTTAASGTESADAGKTVTVTRQVNNVAGEDLTFTIPNKLPNPNALSVKTAEGAGGTSSYDGSGALEVDLTAYESKTHLFDEPTAESPKIKSALLPSFVDDVVEGYYHDSAFYADEEYTQLIQGETGKIYVDLTEGAGNACYRWSGSAYVKISSVDITSKLDKPTGLTSDDNGKAVTVTVNSSGAITASGVATLGFQVMKDTSTSGHVGEYYIEDPNV